MQVEADLTDHQSVSEREQRIGRISRRPSISSGKWNFLGEKRSKDLKIPSRSSTFESSQCIERSGFSDLSSDIIEPGGGGEFPFPVGGKALEHPFLVEDFRIDDTAREF